MFLLELYCEGPRNAAAVRPRQILVTYNAKKSKIMIVRSKEDRQLTFPDFFLSGSGLDVCSEIKYLGHIISNDLSDDMDIYRQRR